ncbi:MULTISPECIES: hypothetical protein [Streptomyces diastaticus group]|uniref:hypothetical protein n=1 Tax=Streptomyces diastaticus group TaxID=2849069 RepID=UPI0037AE279B
MPEQAMQSVRKKAYLILDGAVLPIDRVAADQPCEQLNYCGYSANRQVVIDADSRLGVVVGRPLLGHRNDCRVWA